MSEVLTSWLVTGLVMLALLPVPDAKAAEFGKDQSRIEGKGARCIKATSQAFYGNADHLSLTVIDVDCCSGIPAGVQCYVTQREKVFQW